MQKDQKYTVETVLQVKHHTEKHLSFTLTRPESFRFDAGQFARLGIDSEPALWRAYSMVSAEYDDFLEFFVVLIPNGPFSKHLQALKPGDKLLLEKTAHGFFLPERFQDGKSLIMLATGSGLAPFLSMIKQPSIWQRFEQLVLVHSVSFAGELVYQDSIQQIMDNPYLQEQGARLHYQPVLTREQKSGCLNKRLPECISSGLLEETLASHFSIEDTRFMICGNPQMITDTHKALTKRGFTLNRVRIPGQILLENGF